MFVEKKVHLIKKHKAHFEKVDFDNFPKRNFLSSFNASR